MLCTRWHRVIRYVCVQVSVVLKSTCHRFLLGQLPSELHDAANTAAGLTPAIDAVLQVTLMDGRWGIAPFYVQCRDAPAEGARFNFEAPTTARNVMRVLRALQVR